jgi:hypothetical protein
MNGPFIAASLLIKVATSTLMFKFHTLRRLLPAVNKCCKSLTPSPLHSISKDVPIAEKSWDWEGRCVGATLIAVNGDGRVRVAAQGGKMRGSHTI